MTESLSDLENELEQRGCSLRGYVYRVTPVKGEPGKVNVELVRACSTVEDACAFVVNTTLANPLEHLGDATYVVLPRVELLF